MLPHGNGQYTAHGEGGRDVFKASGPCQFARYGILCPTARRDCWSYLWSGKIESRQEACGVRLSRRAGERVCAPTCLARRCGCFLQTFYRILVLPHLNDRPFSTIVSAPWGSPILPHPSPRAFGEGDVMKTTIAKTFLPAAVLLAVAVFAGICEDPWAQS